MNLHPIDITIIAGYLVFCLIIGLIKFGKIKNIRDFTLGTKPFSTTVLVATTFATFIGSQQIFGNMAKVYELGLIFIIPLFLTPMRWYILAKVFAPNLNQFHQKKFMSLSEIMEYYYGKVGRWLCNFLSIILTIGVIAIAAIAIGYLLHYFVHIPKNLGMFIGVAVVTLYSAFGGIASVAFTDVFQFLIFFIALPVSCLIGYQQNSGIENILQSLPAHHLTINKADILLFLSFVFYILLPRTDIPFIQRALIAKDKKQLLTSFYSVSLLSIPILIVVTIIGLIVYKHTPNLESNTIFYYYIDQYLGPGIKGLMIAGVLAVIMSTQDSFLNSVSALISRDICKSIWPFITAKQELLIARIACIIIALISMSVVFLHQGIMEVIWFFENFWEPLVTFPLLAGLLGARISRQMFNVLIFSSLSTIICVRLITGIFDTRSLVAGVLTSIFILYIGNKQYKKQHPQLVQKKTKTESLTIKLKNSLFENRLSTQSLYLVTITLSVGLIIGTGFVGIEQFTLLNTSFLCLATACILLLLNDFWGYKTRNFVLFIWQILFLFCLILLPSYLLVLNKFNTLWAINLILSITLFATFTNKVRAIITGILGLIFCYLSTKFHVTNFVLTAQEMKIITFGYMLSIVISLVITIYQTKYVSKEIVRQLETKVAERTSELKKALYVKQEFLNKLNHEIRTPVHIISGLSENILNIWHKSSKEELKQYIEMIAKNNDRLIDFTSNILDLASINQSKFTLKLEKNVDLIKIAKDTIQNAETLIGASGKNLQINLKVKNDIPLIACDRVKVGQIISNLLSNSIKYSDKGKIEVLIAKSNKNIEIHVIDSGVGIPKDEQSKVFESFYESSRTKTSAEGKGLGLAIVKEFVQLHKGNIAVSNNKPQGTVIVVMLPL